MKPKKEDSVIALFVADLHLSLTPPPFRSNEPDWFKAMARPMEGLKALQEEHNGCPIFCAGDIFDKWYGSKDKGAPALINFAMENLPYMHCIPGQHDMPDHDLGQIERSAYWTLAKAARIHDLSSTIEYYEDGLMVYPFCYGKKVTPFKGNRRVHPIALIHEYNWAPGHKHIEAPNRQEVTHHRKEFEGYDIVVSGDNHSPFDVQIGKIQFWNCGTFLRRKSDESDYRPQIGMLMSDGRIVPHYLDTTQDKYLETADETEPPEDMDLSGLMETLGKLGECALDFSEAIKHQLAWKPVNKRVKTLIHRAME